MDATSIDDIINYHFRSEELRNEATLAAGASVSDVNIHDIAQGDRNPPHSIIPKLFITALTCSKFLRESNQTAPTKPSIVEAIVVRDTSFP